MILARIENGDMIVLQTVNSYLKQNCDKQRIAITSPQEKILLTQNARDALYSEIVHRVPRIAAYIMQADIEQDDIAQGLLRALENHVQDPVFIDLLMQRIQRANDAEERGATASLLVTIADRYITKNKAETDAKPKKKDDKEKEEKSTVNEEFIKQINQAVHFLIGAEAAVVSTRCPNLQKGDALTVASCLMMNNSSTIKELLKANIPITAQIFDEFIQDPTNLIKSALLLKKDELVKYSDNQQRFIDSLKRWVYNKLNIITPQQCYQFLISVYGSTRPKGEDIQMYMIYLPDCGSTYAQLHNVATALIIN